MKTLTPYKEYTFFDKTHQFCHWYRSPFIINNMSFYSVEQYIAYRTAVLCGEIDTSKLLLETYDTDTILAISSTLNKSIKPNVLFDIAITGNIAKFTDNVTLYNELKSTRGEIVAAFPDDRFWGIGYIVHNAEDNKLLWGQNVLGRILTGIRDEFELG